MSEPAGNLLSRCLLGRWKGKEKPWRMSRDFWPGSAFEQNNAWVTSYLITYGKWSVESVDRSPVGTDGRQLVDHCSEVMERHFDDRLALTSIDVGVSCVFEHAPSDRLVANSFLERGDRCFAPSLSRLQSVDYETSPSKEERTNLFYQNHVGINRARGDYH